MDLSIFEKIGIVLRHTFSSFLEIELFILCLLFLILLVININKKNKLVNILVSLSFIIFILTLIISNIEYSIYCIDKVLKLVMNYIYFPSVVVFFFLEAFVIVMLVVTIFSNKIKFIKKIINYICFMIFNFLFFSFISLIIYNKINLLEVVDLYKDDTILSIVQCANGLVVCWGIFTLFYLLYNYFKEKYDSNSEKVVE